MTAMNGQGDASATSASALSKQAAEKAGRLAVSEREYNREKINRTVTELEVPFDPSVILWRVTNTTKVDGQLRGQVIPYADPRAYTDRLNTLFTPAGWTRKYAVHTSPNFQRIEDQRTVAKVFVTCDVTIFGLGSHSATGEEWVDDSNAGTSAEAQAFKRACCCFGLGRYLYYFSGLWVDLDERKRPLCRPALAGWATPQGWRDGLRPQAIQREPSTGNISSSESDELVRQIEAMSEVLGKGLYRGILKAVARAWSPKEIQDISLRERVLRQMQAAERGLKRLETALEEKGSEASTVVLRSFGLNSLEQVRDLETLKEVVLALENHN